MDTIRALWSEFIRLMLEVLNHFLEFLKWVIIQPPQNIIAFGCIGIAYLFLNNNYRSMIDRFNEFTQLNKYGEEHNKSLVHRPTHFITDEDPTSLSYKKLIEVGRESKRIYNIKDETRYDKVKLVIIPILLLLVAVLSNGDNPLRIFIKTMIVLAISSIFVYSNAKTITHHKQGFLLRLFWQIVNLAVIAITIQASMAVIFFL